MTVITEKLIDIDEIRTIIHRRISSATSERKKGWPKILRDPEPDWSHHFKNGQFLLYFLDYDLLKLQINFANTRYGPLPGLIAPSANEPAAMDLDRSKNIDLQSNYFEGVFILRLGEDCTVTVKNHPISINLPQYGSLRYSIPLAFIITMGEEITTHDIPERFDELLAYSLGLWSKNEP